MRIPAPGSAHPLGATVRPDGVNFSVYAAKAQALWLLLFDRVEDAEPAQSIALDRQLNRTDGYWHVAVPDLAPGQVYGYRAEGPNVPERGLHFDPEKLLLDPYGRAVAVPAAYSRAA